MTSLKEKTGVWFVYDGDCPICTKASQVLRIKKRFGSLSVLNAREINNDPLIDEINYQGFDLDEGMVIYTDGQFYYGKEALRFIAKYGQTNNLFMLMSKGLFWSDTLSTLIYPWMRGTRNWLLRKRKVGRIDNLNFVEEPIFKSIFGKDWHSLPPVMKKHYANHPYTNEKNTVEGVLNVFCNPPLSWLSPLMKLLGQIPAYIEEAVPVTVCFESDINSKAFHFNRRFHFSGRKPYVFHSKMLPINDNEMVEIMKFGLAWRMEYFWDGEKVILSHKGYALNAFGHLIPLPITMLLGAGNAVEYPVDDETFDMEVTITHPWFGVIYGYNGRFKVLS